MGEDVTQLHAQIELLLSLHIVNMSGITSSLIEHIPHCIEQVVGCKLNMVASSVLVVAFMEWQISKYFWQRVWLD